jgi:acetyl-CoA decarbonylase/synthase complex subunit beta
LKLSSKGLFSDIPVDVGVVYEGERIRTQQMYVELGGPNEERKFELVQARTPQEIEDGKFVVVGPDLKDMKEGAHYPLGILIEVSGKEVERDLESVIERRIHQYSNYVQGLMHLNQRYDIWLRLSKDSFKKGFNSFKYLGKVLQRLYKAELPIIEKIQVTFITDPEKIKDWYDKSIQIYEARDARARKLKESEVKEFYGCVLCQSFAPTHVCVITPERVSLCGSINWFDARAAARVDPKGPNFMIPKGELLDPEHGEYSGANEAVQKKSLGGVKKIYLHSMFGHPHTSCGCFESIAYYIPEVDGVGIVDRHYKGNAVNGLPFSAMANETGGGKQVEGFVGIAIEYMRSPSFFKADGGWNRVVWLPSNVKERVKDSIPADLKDKIATEKDAQNIQDLKSFLKSKGHPVVSRWAPEEAAKALAVAEASAPEAMQPMMAGSTITLPVGGGGAMGGYRLTLKNVKIVAKKLILKKAK